MFRTILGLGAALALASGAASAQDAEKYVDQPAAISAQISPNGQEVAFIGRSEEVQQLLVVNLASKQTRVIQSVKQSKRFDLDWVRWKGNDRLVIGATVELVERGRAPTGQTIKLKDQSFFISRVFSIGADGKNAVQMFQGQLSTLVGNLGSTMLLDELPGDASHVMMSAIDNSGFGAWKADVTTGKVERIANGGWQTADYWTDGAGYPVLRIDATANVVKLFRRASGAENWIPAREIRRNIALDTPDFDMVGPGPAKNQVYVLARNDGDRAALFLYDTATGAFSDPIFKGAEADASTPWIRPSTHEVMATCEFATRLACRMTDPRQQKYLGALDQFFDKQATVRLVNMSDDETRWLLHVEGPTETDGYYVFDIKALKIDILVGAYPGLAGEKLSPTEVVPYASRDGTKLWAYVTSKPGEGARPMVVLPHGGPESRDAFGFEPFAQFLAAQGYVVVQPNFRGSGGFGEAFADAGRGQWGKRMQDDVTDVVKHMVDAGRADPKRICIVGASYGGYAALAGATLTPELYRCAVSISGVSDLNDVLRVEKSDSGGSSNAFYYWRESIGNPDKERDALAAVSPRKLVAKVAGPVLLIHGDEDTTVPIGQSLTMRDALKAAGKDVKLVRFPNADHYWANWDRKDRLTMFQEVAAFLKQNLAN